MRGIVWIAIIGAAALIIAGALRSSERNEWERAAEIARLEAEQRRAADLYALDTALAAAWRVLPLAAALGVLAYLAALGYAHVERVRRERWPRDGVLPVPADRLADVAPASLDAWHAARHLAAVAADPPHHLHYAPHVVIRDGAGVPPETPTPAEVGLPGVVDLATLGHTPRLDSILLGLGPGGERITVPVGRLCHVALVGATGGGKSNLLRLLIPQLQAIGARVTLADPHYAPYDPETGEDWRPIADRLHLEPARTPDQIGALLDYLHGELHARLERRNRGEPPGPPLFLAYDELPVIVDAVKGAMDAIADLARQGRKVRLYVLGASQTMLVKAVGGDSAARDQFRTAFYVGGDVRSAAALLDLPQRDIAEGALTVGVAYLRSAATTPPCLVRVPLASNAGVAALLSAGVTGSDAGSSAGSAAPAPPSSPPSSPSARLSPDEARIVEEFLAGKSVTEIAEGIAGTRGGRRYQEAAARVGGALRRALRQNG